MRCSVTVHQDVRVVEKVRIRIEIRQVLLGFIGEVPFRGIQVIEEYPFDLRLPVGLGPEPVILLVIPPIRRVLDRDRVRKRHEDVSDEVTVQVPIIALIRVREETIVTGTGTGRFGEVFTRVDIKMATFEGGLGYPSESIGLGYQALEDTDTPFGRLPEEECCVAFLPDPQ